jgi:hypothetical protein
VNRSAARPVRVRQRIPTARKVLDLSIFVNSYNFPVNGGTITFQSADAASGSCKGFPPICTYDFGAGGDFLITGSVFGLPAGSTLIAGTFLAGGSGVGEPYGSSFNGNFQVTYLNPTILGMMGLPADFGSGDGSLPAYDSGGFPWSATVTVTTSATPEPDPASLLASGLLMLAACRTLLRSAPTANDE